RTNAAIRLEVAADRTHVTGFQRQVVGEFALHIEQPLHRIGSASIELVGEGLGRKYVGYRTHKAGRPIEPGFGGKIGIVVVPRASGGIAADIETRITLVLVVEHAGSGTDRPLRTRAPGESQARSEVIVVSIHQAIAEPSILHQRDIGPADLQSRIRISGTLALAQEDGIAALVRLV